MRDFDINPSKSIVIPRISRSRTSSLSPIKYSVGYTGLSLPCVVGIIDLVESTKISAHMPPNQWGRYYEIFLNSISNDLYKFGGFVIKNVGDGLLFYFSDSFDSKQKTSYRTSIECGLEIADSHKKICKRLDDNGLPCVNFRISLDYGKVIIMKTSNCNYIDILGPPVNMCSKINHFASINGLVIGGDLHQLIKNSKDFHFQQEKGHKIDGMKFEYPIYSVQKK